MLTKILKVARKSSRAVLRSFHWSRRFARLAGTRARGIFNGARYAGVYAQQTRYFANPGREFEQSDAQLGPVNGVKRAKAIAFYLPQYHRFKENDEWWGTGFSEWRNVARAAPRFIDHYQPRIPRDLGFYDLGHEQTIREQASMAKANGIDAFCFYYYRFNDKRLMEKPLDLFLESDIDHEFCIMWANENWTRTWDGKNDVLITQDYLDENEDAFIVDTARYMKDQRYTRINNRPLFILYRPGLLPDMANTLTRWRQKWIAELGVEPVVMMVQGFGKEDPREYGFDAAIEFPPHKICDDLPLANHQYKIIDPAFSGRIRHYEDAIKHSLSIEQPGFPLIKGVTPSWDNDARRQGAGSVLHGSTPALYEQWLNGAIDYAEANPVEGASCVFVNAWNEWAEGAYLEPDVHFGHAYLNATRRAVYGLEKAKPVLLVGHDAHKHGAQMLLLNIAKVLKTKLSQDVVVLLKDGGELLEAYRRVAPTYVLDKTDKDWLQQFVTKGKFEYAVTNTAVTGDLVPALKACGLRVSSLVHEMPALIADYQLEEHVKALAGNADVTVFAAKPVQSGFNSFVDASAAEQIIKPQGSYIPVEFDPVSRDRLRAMLGVSATQKVVLNAGYADQRKGFDLFVQAAARQSAVGSDVQFVWAGAIEPGMLRWFNTTYSDDDPVRNNLQLLGFTQDIAQYYSAADVFFLSSREDPYPTVVLEAMNAGLPVVVLRGNTGFDELMLEYGYIASESDNDLIDDCIYTAMQEGRGQSSAKRIDYIHQHARFEDYCEWLIELQGSVPEVKSSSSARAA